MGTRKFELGSCTFRGWSGDVDTGFDVQNDLCDFFVGDSVSGDKLIDRKVARKG